MVDCSQFLEGYSEFRDGLLDGERWEALDAHRSSCASCARYDRVIGGGVEVFCGLPEITPSADFAARLQHRIFHLEMEGRTDGRSASGASAALVLAVAAAIGLSAWLPALRPEAAPVRLAPMVAHAPYHEPVVPLVFRSPPVLTRSRWAAAAPAATPVGLQTVEFRETPLSHRGPVFLPVAALPDSLLYLTGH